MIRSALISLSAVVVFAMPMAQAQNYPIKPVRIISPYSPGGLGDLVLTCSSPQSRNMSLGLALGQGQTVEQALAGKRSVAEGYESAPAVRELAARVGVDMPISRAVAALLNGESTVEAMIESLLSRPLKAERH